MIQRHVDHRRRHASERHLFAADEIEEGRRFKLLDDDVRAAHAGHCIRQAPAVAMKLRQRVQIDLAFVYAEFADRIDGVDVEIAMRQHHALRPACGA